jgi:NRAMP (natural resistance-associated macrophage protein)-like metal ion transporter
MYWLSKSFHLANRTKRRLFILLAVLGPGVMTMVADNDAGGISTYAVTGSKYGFKLLWILMILLPMAYFIQEMTVRLGAVTKRGQAEAIFDGFGKFWGWFSLADLAVVNWLTLITEYVGMTAAMTLFGIPPWLTVIAVTAVLLAVVMTGKYWTFEKLTLLFCAFNVVYVPAAFWAMRSPTVPGWGAVWRGLLRPELPAGHHMGDFLFIVLANIGTTITPWQIFFQQSSVVDKGLDLHDIKYGKIDTLMGSLLTCLVAAFIMITTGAAFYYHVPPITVEDARQTAEALMPLLPHGQGHLARTLFAVGLFDAGFLGALCISLSTSWQAPWFYVIYLFMLLTAGLVVLIPGAPLITITMYVQVVAVTLLPSVLIFLLIMLNDRQFMGEHVNTRWQNLANGGIVVFVTLMSTLFALTTLFPGLFGAK